MKVKFGIVCFAAVGKALDGPRWRQALVLRRIDVALLVVRLNLEAAHSDAVVRTKASKASKGEDEGASKASKVRTKGASKASKARTKGGGGLRRLRR